MFMSVETLHVKGAMLLFDCILKKNHSVMMSYFTKGQQRLRWRHFYYVKIQFLVAFIQWSTTIHLQHIQNQSFRPVFYILPKSVSVVVDDLAKIIPNIVRAVVAYYKWEIETGSQLYLEPYEGIFNTGQPATPTIIFSIGLSYISVLRCLCFFCYFTERQKLWVNNICV